MVIKTMNEEQKIEVLTKQLETATGIKKYRIGIALKELNKRAILRKLAAVPWTWIAPNKLHSMVTIAELDKFEPGVPHEIKTGTHLTYNNKTGITLDFPSRLVADAFLQDCASGQIVPENV